MRAFILLLMLIFSFPVALWPQVEKSALSELSLTVGEKQNELSKDLFRQAVFDDVEDAEQFYWIHLGRKHAMAPKLAYELAVYFEKNYDYDKASVFYKECMRFNPEDVSVLLALAKVDVLRGKEDEAIHTYERVLRIHPSSLDANIYAANYYYLQAKLEKQKIERDYKRIQSPTHMQYAHYRNELYRVFEDNYAKARIHFENVIKQFSSIGARKALAEIQVVEKEISR